MFPALLEMLLVTFRLSAIAFNLDQVEILYHFGAEFMDMFEQLLDHYPFPKQALVFMCLQCRSFENTVGKGEIARNEQFSTFSFSHSVF